MMINIAVWTFILLFFVEKMGLFFARFFCLFAVVQERRCLVFTQWGSVVGILKEPGL